MSGAAATPPALRISCGSCHVSINVPYQLLPNLLQSGRFVCPGCRSQQSISIAPDLAKSLSEQLRKWQLANGINPAPQPATATRPGGPPAAAKAASSPATAQAKVSAQQSPVDPKQKRLPFGSRISAPENEELELELEAEEEDHHIESNAFTDYQPKKLKIGSRHPDPVVETASLAAVDPPDISYELQMNQQVILQNRLSALQLEAITYACQRHKTILPDGNRAGFFIGDGAGVGKGRTLAGLVMENWAAGRRRHVWVSTSSDLRFDTQRDLSDVLGKDIEVYSLNKLPYGKLDAASGADIQEGVIFATYSALIAQSEKGGKRLKQLVNWCGKGFDGLLLFDECHKAKNLVPDKGAEPTRTGKCVLELQNQLPMARVVYCSATGASEPRHLGYMVRLGLWGVGNPSFGTFGEFLNGLGSRGMAALELVAMDMKARGMFVCRSLSFAHCEFDILSTKLEPGFQQTYCDASAMWNKLRGEFLEAEEQSAEKPSGRFFWAAHQRFFRSMCMSAKIPMLVRKAKEALAEGKCVVIGLQSTGEAMTTEAVAERGTDIEDFVSGPKEMLLKVLEDCYPLPAHPDKHVAGARAELKDLLGSRRAVDEALGIASEGGNPRAARAGSRNVQYNPNIRFSSEEDDTSDSDESSDESSSDDDDHDVDEDELEVAIVHAGSSDESDGEKRSKRSDLVKRGSKSDLQTAGGSPNQAASAGAGPGSVDDQSLADEGSVAKAAENKPKTRRGRPARQKPDAEDDTEGLSQNELYQRAKERFDSALRRKAELKVEIEALELPTNPLDDIIDQLGGADHVAEMTGRKGRFMRKAGGGVQFEPRNASGVSGASLDMVNVAERELFQGGEKRVAVISEAASAGISLHADRRVKNKARRVHLTLELPWSADKAIQQFGRSHRSNEVSGPQYFLCFTQLGGEKRFAAAVSRRLETLGALTQGDRRAGPSLGECNYDSEWGKDALATMYDSLLEEKDTPVVPPMCQSVEGNEGAPPPMSAEKFASQARFHLFSVGLLVPRSGSNWKPTAGEFEAPASALKITDSEKVHVPRFLNRLLGLAPSAQKMLFDFFQEIMDYVVLYARRSGMFDDGIVDMKGDVKAVGNSTVVYKDLFSQAPTWHTHLQVDRGVSWEKAERMLELGLPTANQLEVHDREAAALTPSADRRLSRRESQIPADAVSEAAREGEAASRSPEGNKSRGQTADAPGTPGGKEQEEGALSNGFYESRNAGPGGKRPILLAMHVPGSSPPVMRVTRPATGTFGKEMKLRKLQSRYVRLKANQAKAAWEHVYQDSHNVRVKTLHMLRGLVLPVWGVVENALLITKGARVKSAKKLKVVRVMATGLEEGQQQQRSPGPAASSEALVPGSVHDSDAAGVGAGEVSRKVVGILVPKEALKEVLLGLREQQKHVERFKEELTRHQAAVAAARQQEELHRQQEEKAALEAAAARKGRKKKAPGSKKGKQARGRKELSDEDDAEGDESSTDNDSSDEEPPAKKGRPASRRQPDRKARPPAPAKTARGAKRRGPGRPRGSTKNRAPIILDSDDDDDFTAPLPASLRRTRSAAAKLAKKADSSDEEEEEEESLSSS